MLLIDGDLDDPRVIALLRTHVDRARAETAPGSAHALDLEALKAPDITFRALWEGDTLVAIGALRRLSASEGEIKSMHVRAECRGGGHGRAMLADLIALARAAGLGRVSLETGAWDYFRPAHALYASAGFVPCAPFGDYHPDRNSHFLTLALD